ncbi:hypothetical protein [Haloquadratum walsbyi]|jgi:hypothetical protein|uniref:Uncharacterized protein n=1 Tax=Haloquadratum walsbyi J07HQW2 TaxID=1238425 RepID=U1NEC8_9EURY|nr:hypothetical protein [Haloquadratum walsbyi]ERG95113.1 MAG: hypothetical protein J07HQW2_01559 [Haloquadratum walsbyi J07HQW2]
MNSSDAARQLRYAVTTQTETYDYEVSHWEANAYEDIFDDVIDAGDLSDVMSVIKRISAEFDDGTRPSVTEARKLADSVLTTGGRPITDGGDAN